MTLILTYVLPFLCGMLDIKLTIIFAAHVSISLQFTSFYFTNHSITSLSHILIPQYTHFLNYISAFQKILFDRLHSPCQCPATHTATHTVFAASRFLSDYSP